ncbi:type II toxin-antitoxin system VapC family toxin [Armatimonas sp.]|uniref:type II toxin-antitoxin system VapC family toxin n=1 Tax=Armatimonas sp. TaxID=1872638 RepID=UPI00375012CB
MRLLLDTHALLWYIWGDSSLTAIARKTIEDPHNIIYVSTASQWEITVKYSLGKLILNLSLPDFLAKRIDGNGFLTLPIEHTHLLTLPSLSMHHRDPFDRILIAQSIAEVMPIISADAAFDAYPVTRIW